MAILNPYTTANRNGIPRIESTGVNVGADRVTFTFNTQHFLGYPYNGLVAFRIATAIPTGTTATLPIYIGTQPLVGLGGTAITAGDLTSTGIILTWYDSALNLLQVINIV